MICKIHASLPSFYVYKHHCMSPMGCRFQMLFVHTFVFGDIGLRRKKLKKLFKNL